MSEHVSNDPTNIERALLNDKVRDADVSMFTIGHVVNCILQRSKVLYDCEKPDQLIKQWGKGNKEPLLDARADRQEVFVRRTLASALIEYETLTPFIQKIKQPNIVTDIGCGYGFIDLFIQQEFDCELRLVDLEQTDEIYFSYRKQGAAYSNLGIAKEFLVANGVNPDKITTINPRTNNLIDFGHSDLSISLLSCGFHYPLSTYGEYFEQVTKTGGIMIVDLRSHMASEEIRFLSTLGISTTAVSDSPFMRVLGVRDV